MWKKSITISSLIVAFLAGALFGGQTIGISAATGIDFSQIKTVDDLVNATFAQKQAKTNPTTPVVTKPIGTLQYFPSDWKFYYVDPNQNKRELTEWYSGPEQLLSYNGNTYVRLTFVMRALGYGTHYKADTKELILYHPAIAPFDSLYAQRYPNGYGVAVPTTPFTPASVPTPDPTLDSAQPYVPKEVKSVLTMDYKSYYNVLAYMNTTYDYANYLKEIVDHRYDSTHEYSRMTKEQILSKVEALKKQYAYDRLYIGKYADQYELAKDYVTALDRMVESVERAIVDQSEENRVIAQADIHDVKMQVEFMQKNEKTIIQ